MVLVYFLCTGRAPPLPTRLHLDLVENLRSTLGPILFILTIIALARAYWRNGPDNATAALIACA